jgi:DHA1 family multidrug resistance protein-like MFS transporter
MGGLLAGESLSIPFFVAGGMSILALILTALFLPESLPSQARQQDGEAKALDLRLWWRSLFSPMGSLLVITFIMTSGLMIFYGIFGLYALERYAYGPDEVGIVFMAAGLVSALTQGLLAGTLTKRWGDATVIKVGMLATTIGFGLMLLANTFATVLLTIGFFVLGTALLAPAVMALTSKRATLQQGIAMGLSNSSMSLGRIVGPLAAGVAFDLNPNLPYLGGAAIMLVGFVLSLVLIPVEKQPSPPGITA